MKKSSGCFVYFGQAVHPSKQRIMFALIKLQVPNTTPNFEIDKMLTRQGVVVATRLYPYKPLASGSVGTTDVPQSDELLLAKTR